jgi:hypothetical protein
MALRFGFEKQRVNCLIGIACGYTWRACSWRIPWVHLACVLDTRRIIRSAQGGI